MRKKCLQIIGMLIFLGKLTYASGSYSIALSGMGMDYTETDIQGKFADSETSNSLLGFEINYGFDLGCNSIGCPTFVAEFSAYSGESDYKGSYLVSAEPVSSTTFNILYNVEFGVIQKTKFSLVDLSYGLGIGYHTWYRELSSTQNELYYWLYVAPEIAISKNLNQHISIGLELKYKYALLAEMLANDFDDPFKLGDTYTMELSVPLLYKLTREIDLFAQWTYAKQVIGRSNFQNGYLDGIYYEGIYEPDSIDHQNYIKIGATFKY